MAKGENTINKERRGPMSDVHLTMATWDYDHIRDLASGLVKPKGIELTHLQMEVEEIFYRFSNALEWDVSELSFAKYCSVQSQDDPPFIGIPVFVSRVFRQSAFFIKKGGSVSEPGDMKGKRIGIPEWSQTATVYARGWMMHDLGIGLDEVEWVQAGVNDPGRVEMAHLNLPPGTKYTQVPDRSLAEMLMAGDIDAMISAHPPQLFKDGHPDIVRLLPDYRSAEEAHFGETGIYPIMHTIAIRGSTYEKYPWAPMNLLNAFDEARRRSVARLTSMTASQIPVPWGPNNVEAMHKRFWPNDEYWAYGIDANRTTIEAFLQYCDEQGVTHRKLTPEDLYPREVQSAFKI